MDLELTALAFVDGYWAIKLDFYDSLWRLQFEEKLSADLIQLASLYLSLVAEAFFSGVSSKFCQRFFVQNFCVHKNFKKIL